MARADGSLSAIQFEIMTIVWDKDPKGVSVTEVWEEIGENRKVVRSTIQNTIERLAADGWLKRRRLKSGLRFRAAVARDEVKRQLTEEFVDSFFGGSATDLVLSVLGAQMISPDEARQLRRLLEQAGGNQEPNE